MKKLIFVLVVVFSPVCWGLDVYSQLDENSTLRSFDPASNLPVCDLDYGINNAFYLNPTNMVNYLAGAYLVSDASNGGYAPVNNGVSDNGNLTSSSQGNYDAAVLTGATGNAAGSVATWDDLDKPYEDAIPDSEKDDPEKVLTRIETFVNAGQKAVAANQDLKNANTEYERVLTGQETQEKSGKTVGLIENNVAPAMNNRENEIVAIREKSSQERQDAIKEADRQKEEARAEMQSMMVQGSRMIGVEVGRNIPPPVTIYQTNTVQ